MEIKLFEEIKKQYEEAESMYYYFAIIKDNMERARSYTQIKIVLEEIIINCNLMNEEQFNTFKQETWLKCRNEWR